MYTSSFKLSGNDPKAVAITRGLPRFPPWKGHVYRTLAPTSAMLKMPLADYNRHFDAMLASLDPHAVYQEIVNLAGPDAILCCYEPPNVCCHRRRVAEWFETSLGIVIPEVGFDRAAILPYAEMPETPTLKKNEPGNMLKLFSFLIF